MKSSIISISFPPSLPLSILSLYLSTCALPFIAKVFLPVFVFIGIKTYLLHRRRNQDSLGPVRSPLVICPWAWNHVSETQSVQLSPSSSIGQSQGVDRGNRDHPYFLSCMGYPGWCGHSQLFPQRASWAHYLGTELILNSTLSFCCTWLFVWACAIVSSWDLLRVFLLMMALLGGLLPLQRAQLT